MIISVKLKIHNYFYSGLETAYARKLPDNNGKCTYELTNEEQDVANCSIGCLTDNLRKNCILSI